MNEVGGRAVDVVLSDMAPNTSGMAAVDQPRMMYLCELAVDFALKVLPVGGALIMKVFSRRRLSRAACSDAKAI